MANAVVDIGTVEKGTNAYQATVDFPLPASGIAYAGTMQSVDANGRLKNPVTTTELVVGVVRRKVDNTGGANDAKRAELNTGLFRFLNSGTNAITAASVGKVCYAEDNQTLGSLNTAGSKAGIVFKLDGIYVWAFLGPQFVAGV